MKSEHIKKTNNNKFFDISIKTTEELEMLKYNLHTIIENLKETEKDFIENNLK